jgi:hypothetical protein
MKRPYRSFPYVDVLTHLLAGNGYESTAKKFEYFEADKPDPTKRFRTLLRHARKVGFMHEGKRERFPEFTRQGKPIFTGGRRSPFITSLMPRKRVVKPKATEADLYEVKASFETLPRWRSNNTVLFMLNEDKDRLNIHVPQLHTSVCFYELTKAISALRDDWLAYFSRTVTHTKGFDPQPKQQKEAETEAQSNTV